MASGVANVVAETSAQGGAEEASEYLQQKQQTLVGELRQFLVELNSLYIQTASEDNIENLVKIRANAMREAIEKANIDEDVMEEIRHPSSKGGADIIDNDEVAQKMQDLQRRKAEAYRTLYGARNDIYKLNIAKKENDRFKELALKGMQIVYKLRQEFLGEVEEKIAVTFNEGGYLKVVTVPMSEFLANAKSYISITEESFSKQLYGDPYKIALRNSKTVIEQLKNLQGAEVTDLHVNGQVATKQLYDQLKVNRNFLLRQGDGYDVVSKQKGQGGFIAEAMVRATFGNDDIFAYRQDRANWYKEPDVLDKFGNGFSVKNAIDSNATLLRINSLQTVVSQLISILSSTNLTPTQMVNTIKSTVFGQVSDLDAKVDEYVLKIVSEGLGI